MFRNTESVKETKLPAAVDAESDNRYPEIPDGYFNIQGAAEYADLGQQRIRRLCLEDRIPGAYKEEGTGRWLIPAKGLDTYAANKGGRRDGKKAFVIKFDTAEIEPGEVLAVLQEHFSADAFEDIVPRYKRKPKESKEKAK